jgi:hypothetical protein
MRQRGQCARDIHINAQRAASKPLFEDLSPGPAVSYNRNEGILMHTSLQVRVHHQMATVSTDQSYAALAGCGDFVSA